MRGVCVQSFSASTQHRSSPGSCEEPKRLTRLSPPTTRVLSSKLGRRGGGFLSTHSAPTQLGPATRKAGIDKRAKWTQCCFCFVLFPRGLTKDNKKKVLRSACSSVCGCHGICTECSPASNVTLHSPARADATVIRDPFLWPCKLLVSRFSVKIQRA